MFRKLRLLLFLLLSAAFHGYAQVPVANIVASQLSGCPPLAISFNDNSSNSPTSWSWTFTGGAPATSNKKNEAVLYNTPGNYTVTLVATNAFGSSQPVSVQIKVNPIPDANFSISKNSGCYPTTIAFTDLTTTIPGESITSYLWNFGDGTQSTAANPSHKYTTGGNIQVTLFVKNNYGCTGSTQTKNIPNAINLTGGIFPNFNSVLNSSCTLPVTASFNNTTTTSPGVPAPTWSWDFGDGGGFTDNTFQPIHSYNTANNYNVRLAASSTGGCTDTLTVPVNITANGNLTDFTAPDTVCLNSVVSFVNASSPPPISSSWDFGDGTLFGTAKNVTHTYTTTGLKHVVLVNTYAGGCTGPKTKDILVVNLPTTSFTGTNLNSCQPPLTASFTNTSTGASSWFWDFGDGTTSNLQNPGTHTYTKLGNFTVTLTSTAAGGCATSVSKANFVNVQAPTITINNMPAYGCAPYTFTFTATPFSVDGVASYLWDFGNGNTSTSATPPAQIYAAGSYTVKLTITTNGGCSVSTTGTVLVGSVKPVPAFSFLPPTICVNTAVTFTDASAPADKWTWDFGDGSVDNTNTPTPTYKYTKPGTYKVLLKVYKNGCWDTLSHPLVVSPPLAGYRDFLATCANNIFTFVDTSWGPVTTWLWDFNDGSTYNGQTPPAHNFPPGPPKTYFVTLTATTGACTNAVTHTIIANDVATVSLSSGEVCTNSVVTFTKLPNYGTYKYVFEFGDGTYSTSSTSMTTTHSYPNPGTYQVKVIETNTLNGCVDSSVAVPLIVDGPIANFAPPPALTCKALTFNFNDLSVASPGTSLASWFWDFGDGITSTSQNQQHTYTYAGNFTPSLVVKDNKGCVDTFAVAAPITVSIPVASFRVSEDSSCPNAPNPIRFSNTSLGGFNPTYTWTFGDGGTSTGVSPIYTYTAVGNYSVKLSMKDTYGCTSDTTLLTPIIVDTPHADFTMSGNYSACPPFNVVFTFTGSFARFYSWVFTDGNGAITKDANNLFANPGDYDPNLVITSPGGCRTAPDSQHVHIDGPVGAFTYSPLAGCDTLTVGFNVSSTNVVSFKWVFGDNSPSQITTTPTVYHLYNTPGQYYPIVYLQDAQGCTLPKIGTNAINVDAIFATTFTEDRAIVCDTGTVNFANTSSLGDKTFITNYQWDFGDGTVVNGLNPVISHKYTTLGNDSVSLTITTTGGCTDTHKMALFVVPSPKISFTGLLSQCEPATLNFAGVETVVDPNGPLNWAWNFGNGQTASGQNQPNIAYPKAGEYVVYVTATNTKGCSTMTDTAGAATHLFIYPIPTVNAGPDATICDTSTLQINATGTATSYNWDPPVNGNLSCLNCANPIASSPVSTYFVVTGNTLFGCTARDTINVTVNTPVTVTATGTDSVCLGQSTQLQATGATIYTWTPAVGLNNPNIGNPLATPDASQIGTAPSGVITYTVTGFDSKKCYSDTKTVSITAFKYPVIGLVPNATINVGSSYQINSTATTNITSLNWTPPNNLSCTNCLTPVASPSMTTKYTLTAINDGGCVSTDSIHIQVICTGANFFVPNTFSPNGDGVNDYFIVNGVGLNVIPSITIYNRWGQIVFQKSNFAPNSASQAWDGTFNGQPAPPDVYIYTIQILCNNATLISYHGDVTLIR